MQLCLALPVVGAVRVGVALGQQVAEQVRVDLELAGQIGQLPVEVFGDPRPVARQPGWRHFEIERRLLVLGGDRLRAAVMQRRRDGRKTEPALAHLLGLAGDPYAALLALDEMPDADIIRLLNSRLT